MNRRELIRQYKETPRPVGVYRVRNTRNDRAFVASSVDLPAALNRERFQLRMRGHPNTALQRDWDEHGPEAFVFEVLDTLSRKDEADYDPGEDLRSLEELWLERLTPYGERGYNAPKQPAGRAP